MYGVVERVKELHLIPIGVLVGEGHSTKVIQSVRLSDRFLQRGESWRRRDLHDPEVSIEFHLHQIHLSHPCVDGVCEWVGFYVGIVPKIGRGTVVVGMMLHNTPQVKLPAAKLSAFQC